MTNRRKVFYLWAMADLSLGLVLLISPTARTSTHAFDPAKGLAPMDVWGAAAFLLGLAWVIGLACGDHLGHLGAVLSSAVPAALMAGWHAFFVTGLAFAVTNPVVALTGLPAYTAIALMHVLLVADPT